MPQGETPVPSLMDDLSSTPRTHMVEGENQLLLAVVFHMHLVIV